MQVARRTVSNMQITHLGHACVLLEYPSARILIDPGSFSSYAGVNDLDAVLVTHQHADHVEPGKIGALLAANPRAQLHADPETVTVLAEHDVRATATMHGEAFVVGQVRVTPAGRQHAVILDTIPRISNVGVLLTADGEPSFFHPGDALDAQPAGQVDVLAVPVSAPWGSLKETVEFVLRIGPDQVVPIHDALLSQVGRGLYLKHIGTYGRVGGLPVRDLAGGAPESF